MSNDITTRVNELVAAGYGKTLIEGMLRAEGFKKADISAANVPSKKSDENDATAIMQMVIDLSNEKLNNKQKAERIAKAGLCTEKTAYHIMSLMKYVEAYHELMSA